MKNKMTVEQIEAALMEANAKEQKNVDLCAGVRAALVKFDGKQISKRMQTAVEAALPGATVYLHKDCFYSTLSIWGVPGRPNHGERMVLYFGGWEDTTFTLAVFDDKNASYGSAALERIESRNQLLLRLDLLQAVAHAANEQKLAALHLTRVLSEIPFRVSEVSACVEAFLKY